MKSTKMMIAAAAMGGLLAGATTRAFATTDGAQSISNKAVVAHFVGAKASVRGLAKHDCKGMNDCKGQGGCKTADHDCKGKNDCKGKGGCKTDSLLTAQAGHQVAARGLAKHDCKGMNDCKGQGGCKTADHDCKGKNDCKGKGGCKTDSL